MSKKWNNNIIENLRYYEVNDFRYCLSNQLRCNIKDIMITKNEFTNWLNEKNADFKKLTNHQKNFEF